MIGDILSNNWFIGIVGGIFSGLLTTYISRLIFSRRENREYAQRVATANREIIYAVRPGIPEGEIPTLDVIKAIMASTARKYGVEVDDMLTPQQIAEDLVKEVMDSNFISANAKGDFCQKLAHLVAPAVPAPEQAQRAAASSSVYTEERRRLIGYSTWTMGLIVTVMTAAFTLFTQFAAPEGASTGQLDPLVFSFIAAATAITVSLLTFIVWLARREERGPRRQGETRDDRTSSTES